MSSRLSRSRDESFVSRGGPLGGLPALWVALIALAILVLVAGSVGTGAFARSNATPAVPLVPASGGPRVTVTPNHAQERISVTVVGTGFPGKTNARVSLVTPLLPTFPLSGQPYPYNKATSVHVPLSGKFTLDFSIPTVNHGSYQIHVTDGPSITLNPTFTVKSSPSGVTFSTSVTSVAPGGMVKLKGTNFYPYDVENLYISWNNPHHFKTVGTFDDTGTGGIDYKWHVPVGYPPGTYALVVVGDTYGIGVAEITIT
jgi:hypothetical protein